MMRPKDIQDAAAALGNQIKAGVPMADAAARMARFQPAHAQFWTGVGRGATTGQPLSAHLEGEWPTTLVSVVRAGEESGTLPVVLERIEATIELQREIQKLVVQLAYPVGFGALGVGVFVFFMVQVIPTMSTSLGVGARGFVFELSTWMTQTLNDHWLSILLVLGAAIGGSFAWLSVPANRSRVVDLLLRLPVLGPALTSIAYGIWAHHMALVDSTKSVALTDGLELTSDALPARLRAGIRLLAAEAVTRGLSDAANPDRQLPGDPRRDWPFYVPNAFLIAEETGRLDLELERAGAAMLKDGKAQIKVAISLANVSALFVSALLIVGPLAAYYIQLGVALADAMKG